MTLREILASYFAPVRTFLDRRNRRIRYLGDVRRLQLLPGDVIVISVDQSVSEENASRITSEFEGLAPGHKCVVLSDGMRVSTLNTETTKPGEPQS